MLEQVPFEEAFAQSKCAGVYDDACAQKLQESSAQVVALAALIAAGGAATIVLAPEAIAAMMAAGTLTLTKATGLYIACTAGGVCTNIISTGVVLGTASCGYQYVGGDPSCAGMMMSTPGGAIDVSDELMHAFNSTRMSVVKVARILDDIPISLAGHGEVRLLPDGSTPVTVVPPGTFVTIPIGSGYPMTDSAGQLIEAGDVLGGMAAQQSYYLMRYNVDALDGAMTYLPGSSMPDYTLIPPSYPGYDPITVLSTSRTVTTPTPLSELLVPNMGSVNWAACTTIKP